MNYTLMYTEGNEVKRKPVMDSYETIQDCIDWADEKSIPYYLLTITEWDEDEITAQVNLNEVVLDNEREDLTKYIIY